MENVILVILIFLLINYFMNNKLIDTLKKYFKKIESFQGLPYGFSYDMPSRVDNELKKIHHFVQSVVTKKNHYELTPSDSMEIELPNRNVGEIITLFTKKFNCGDYVFRNIKILDKLTYFKNIRGKEVKPFNMSADVFIEGKAIGLITFYVEVFMRDDVISYGEPTITRIKIVGREEMNDFIPTDLNFSTDMNTTESFNE